MIGKASLSCAGVSQHIDTGPWWPLILLTLFCLIIHSGRYSVNNGEQWYMFVTDSSRWLLIGDKKAKDCQVTVLYVGYPSWQSLLSNHYISYGWWFFVPMFNHDHDWHSLWASLVDCTTRFPLDSPWGAGPRMRKPSSPCSMLRRIQIRCSAQHRSMMKGHVTTWWNGIADEVRLPVMWYCGPALFFGPL